MAHTTYDLRMRHHLYQTPGKVIARSYGEARNTRWSHRVHHAVCTHKGYIYLSGGQPPGNAYVGYEKYPAFADVWRSRDGYNWECMTTRALWGPRCGHAIISHYDVATPENAVLYLCGGQNTTGYLDESEDENNYTSSDDGYTWQRVEWGGGYPPDNVTGHSMHGKLHLYPDGLGGNYIYYASGSGYPYTAGIPTPSYQNNFWNVTGGPSNFAWATSGLLMPSTEPTHAGMKIADSTSWILNDKMVIFCKSRTASASPPYYIYHVWAGTMRVGYIDICAYEGDGPYLNGIQIPRQVESCIHGGKVYLFGAGATSAGYPAQVYSCTGSNYSNWSTLVNESNAGVNLSYWSVVSLNGYMYAINEFSVWRSETGYYWDWQRIR